MRRRIARGQPAGGNSLSDLLVFGKRAGQHAAAFARANKAPRTDPQEVESAARKALAPFDRAGTAQAESPYQVQHDLQGMMQDLVGIVRREDEMQRALSDLARLEERATRTGVEGNREYNPGWHTALDLGNLLTVSQAITRSAIERKESRGGHFREDYPDKDPSSARFNILVRKAADGSMQVVRETIPEMPAALKQIIEEMK